MKKGGEEKEIVSCIYLVDLWADIKASLSRRATTGTRAHNTKGRDRVSEYTYVSPRHNVQNFHII